MSAFHQFKTEVIETKPFIPNSIFERISELLDHLENENKMLRKMYSDIKDNTREVRQVEGELYIKKCRIKHLEKELEERDEIIRKLSGSSEKSEKKD